LSADLGISGTTPIPVRRRHPLQSVWYHELLQ
jgi:hypothetical protein